MSSRENINQGKKASLGPEAHGKEEKAEGSEPAKAPAPGEASSGSPTPEASLNGDLGTGRKKSGRRMSGETHAASGFDPLKHVVMMIHVGGNVWGQQAKLSSSSERQGEYSSRVPCHLLALISTQELCHMHPCVPTCHCARGQVFLELKLRQ